MVIVANNKTKQQQQKELENAHKGPKVHPGLNIDKDREAIKKAEESALEKRLNSYKTKVDKLYNKVKPRESNKNRIFAAGLIFYNDKFSLRRCLDSLSLNDTFDYVFCIDGRFKNFGDPKDDPDLSTDGSRELVLRYDNTVLIDCPNAYEVEKREAYLQACRDFAVDYLLIIDSDEYILYSDEDPRHPATDWNTFVNHCIDTCESVKYKKFNVFDVGVEINNKNYVDTLKTIFASSGRERKIRDIKEEEKAKQKEKVDYSDKSKDEIAPILSDVHNTPMRRRQFRNSPRLWHNPQQMKYNGRHYTFHPIDPMNPLHELESVSAIWHLPGLLIGHDHLFKQLQSGYQVKRLRYQKWLIEFEQKRIQKVLNYTGKFDIKTSDLDKINDQYDEIIAVENKRKEMVELQNQALKNLKDRFRSQARST